MGYAALEGKAWVIEHLQHYDSKDDPEVFLDCGAGAGSWLDAIKPWFMESRWIAMEVWKPYIERFCLYERYDFVMELDIRTAPFPQVDVILLGDVLEHMTVEEAKAVWQKALHNARQFVVLSIPIIHYAQGHVHGNPYQEHVHADWSHEQVMSDLGGIYDSWKGSTVGVYLAKGLAL